MSHNALLGNSVQNKRSNCYIYTGLSNKRDVIILIIVPPLIQEVCKTFGRTDRKQLNELWCFGLGFLFFFYQQCEKNGDVKKRKSNQADIPDSLRQEAETCYRLRLPEDFYQFWKFCEELDPEKPCGGFLNIFCLF